MPPQSLRNRYVDNTVATASPAQLLTMLFARLDRDLAQADEALAAGNIEAANDLLQHAQQIVGELTSSLDLDTWAPAKGLRDVYTYVGTRLVQANITKDRRIITECQRVITPLREAWAEAAGKATQ